MDGRELKGDPLGAVSFFGSLEEYGRLEGAVEKSIELSDEGPFAPLVARNTVVLLCLNKPVVVFGTSVDPCG